MLHKDNGKKSEHERDNSLLNKKVTGDMWKSKG